jgi:hypothetical protein
LRAILDRSTGGLSLLARIAVVLVTLVIFAWWGGFLAGLAVRGFYYWRGW